MGGTLGRLVFGGWGQIGVLVAACVALVAGFAWDQRAMGARNERYENAVGVQELSDKGRQASDGVPDDGNNFKRLRQLYPGD